MLTPIAIVACRLRVTAAFQLGADRGNDRSLDQAIDRLETAVRLSANRITVAAAQQMDGAKEIAASFVTRAGEWSAERLRTAVHPGSRSPDRRTRLVQVRQNAARAERASRIAVCIA